MKQTKQEKLDRDDTTGWIKRASLSPESVELAVVMHNYKTGNVLAAEMDAILQILVLDNAKSGILSN